MNNFFVAPLFFMPRVGIAQEQRRDPLCAAITDVLEDPHKH